VHDPVGAVEKKCKEGKKLLLIDGHGLVFRAFYALPELTGPDGTPTNAVVGFFNMFQKVREEW
jgi:DNA polymerase-1